MDNYTCPVCDGRLLDAVAQRVITHADHHVIFDAEYQECESCGEEFVSHAQAARNDEKLRQAMTRYSQYSAGEKP